jgi:hypothetical protein
MQNLWHFQKIRSFEMSKKPTNPTSLLEDKSIANKIIEIITKNCELVHNDQNEAFAIINSGGIRKVFSLSSNSFYEFISNTYYAEKKSALSDASLKTALSTLAGKAKYEGRKCKIYTRIAKTEDGYWLDLCDDKWQAILINGTGWQILSGTNVPLFYRSNSMQAIPMPVHGGSFDGFWNLVNIPSEDRLMVVAWLLECLREETPHVVLELVGEQGSAKSTTQKLLKMLIDPNAANLRSNPTKVENIWIGASNCHLVSFENMSFLPQNFQDALCVLATGGAHATRTLYTNKEEVIIELRKPIVLNGISVNVTAQDLLDRSIHIELPRVEKRLLSNDVEQSFINLQPSLLGGLLNQLCFALNKLPSITIEDEHKPRMLDFAYLGEAVFQANGLAAGTFLSQYKNMRQKGVFRTLEAIPIGVALSNFLYNNPRGWSGQLIELLGILNNYKPHGEGNWPKSGKAMSDSLRRLAPAIRTLGFDCHSDPKVSGNIIWHIKPIADKESNTSPASPSSPKPDIEELGHEGHEGHEINSYQGLGSE